MTSHPLENVKWLLASTLNANAYNPNVVFTPELRLLERSLLLTGWVQPVLVSKDLTIIDGFHRRCLAMESKALQKRDHGKVPCAILDVEPWQAMVLTIRMNRAKGTHVAAKMHDIVRELIDKHNLDPQEIALEIGATREEIDLLYQDGVFSAKKIKDHVFSKAWVPEEVKTKFIEDE
jgi:ParB-like chromosome segregation protein Spo0J